ncbi:hypothetical protein THTE_2720 [Thermogutta terrifontis]|jgi:hypothetical protein|uniref:Uncharacterized protein n=1 Tax=Thermogutta terrifontis TaxID=1331910 RepID=A0A286RHA5_9BACT|nr:hypothetical protein [Thermogutta terrifontis]ASV75322.1 hypothetical protein THTE_2720 [Thermogutta terrifontis]
MRTALVLLALIGGELIGEAESDPPYQRSDKNAVGKTMSETLGAAAGALM